MNLGFYSLPLPLPPLNLVRAWHSFYSSKIYLNPTNYVGWLKPAFKGCVKLVFDLDHELIVRLSPMVLANPFNTKSFLLQAPAGFFVANFRHLVKNVFRNEYSVTIFFFGEDFGKIFKKKLPKFTTIAYKLKGCLRFHTIIFWISPNLAKYTYALLPLEQHHKIERKKTLSSSHQNLAQQGFQKKKNKQTNKMVLAQM